MTKRESSDENCIVVFLTEKFVQIVVFLLPWSSSHLRLFLLPFFFHLFFHVFRLAVATSKRPQMRPNETSVVERVLLVSVNLM